MNSAARAYGLFFLLALPAPEAVAQPRVDDAQARAARLFQEALLDYDRGDLETAIQKLEQAQAAAPHPTVLYNLAQFFETAGRTAEACRAFERYLAAVGSTIEPERAQAVQAKVAALRQRLASLRIDVSPAGAVVQVDAGPHEADGELLVEPGPHRVDVTSDGFEALRLDLRVLAGESRHLVLHLRPLAPGAAIPSTSSTSPAPKATRPAGAAAARSSSLRGWAMVTAGSSLVLAGSAALLHVLNAARADDWRDRDRALDAVVPAARGDAYWRARADNAELGRSLRHVDGLELGLFIGAGVLAATGAGLWLSAPHTASGSGAGVTWHRTW
jgi:tetratricopeptide (TPR) repeat protein